MSVSEDLTVVSLLGLYCGLLGVVGDAASGLGADPLPRATVVLVEYGHAALLHPLVAVEETVRPVAELLAEVVRVEARLAHARRAPEWLVFGEVVMCNFTAANFSHHKPTVLGKRVVPRLRELASSSRGSQDAGFTQPSFHSLACPCM